MNSKLRHGLGRETTGETGQTCGRLWSIRAHKAGPDRTVRFAEPSVCGGKTELQLDVPPFVVGPCTWNRSQNCAEHNGPNLMGTAGTIGERKSIAQCYDGAGICRTNKCIEEGQ